MESLHKNGNSSKSWQNGGCAESQKRQAANQLSSQADRQKQTNKAPLET